MLSFGETKFTKVSSYAKVLYKIILLISLGDHVVWFFVHTEVCKFTGTVTVTIAKKDAMH